MRTDFDEWAKELLPCFQLQEHGVACLPGSLWCPTCVLRPAVTSALRSAPLDAASVTILDDKTLYEIAKYVGVPAGAMARLLGVLRMIVEPASHRQETEGETEALIAKVPHWGRATDGSILPATACREWEQDECIRLGGQCLFAARGKGGS